MEQEAETKTSTPVENVLKPQREWPLRLVGTLFVLAFIFLLAALILTLKNDLVGKRLQELQEELYAFGGEQGMVLEDIVVTGRERTTKEELNQALGLKRGDNMLKINVYDIKEKVEQLPWVKQAFVRRSLLPNVLHIDIEERQVKAIWQINEKFYPLDEDGKIIEADYQITEPILLIVGAGAPENFKNLLDALKDGDKNYIERVKVANFISGRRWNLILDDIRTGITVKLPEDDIAKAWKKLVKLDETKGIFKRKLTIIDLRLPNKVVVKLRKGSEDEPEKLKNTKERLKGFNNILFVGYTNQIAPYLQASDAYISTSLSEGFHLSVYEALACGLPVILSDLDIYDKIKKTGCSFVFSPANPKGLQTKILVFLAHSGTEFSDRAVTFIKQDFSTEKMSLKYQEYYKE